MSLDGLLPGEISVDNFAGGGGASLAQEQALGSPVDIAINHDPEAIAMHRANHPHTRHFCEDVWHVDPVAVCQGRVVGNAWFSPDCTHYSRARGCTPVNKNIRGLAWVAVKWAALVNVRMFELENVKEFRTWGPLIEKSPGKFVPDPDKKGETFEAFILVLTTGLSADHPAWPEIREFLGDDFLHYDKLEKGLGYTVDHKLLTACDYGAGTRRERFFLVARKDGYPVVWPAMTHSPAAGFMPTKTTAECIDWSIPVRSIFGRKKPLADNTLKRIAKGMQKFVIDNPKPFIIRIGHTGFGGDRLTWSIDQPLTTITSKAEHILVVPFLGKKFEGENAVQQKQAMSAFLIKYYGPNVGHGVDEPLHTITSRDRFGLVTVKIRDDIIIDIGMRMLEPRELYRAQGFPDDYIIDVTLDGRKLPKASQVRMCGNSVSPPPAKALIEANINIVREVEAA